MKDNTRLLVSRNVREGFYAGYYPAHAHFGKGGHRRWSRWAMAEFYPRIEGCVWKMINSLPQLYV